MVGAVRWLCGVAALVAAAFVVAPFEAQAQSPMCYDLQAQYSALSARSGSRGGGQRMAQIEAISRELTQAQIAARQGNCNRFLFFGPRASPQCPAINQTIMQLRQQLAALRSRQSGGFFGGGQADRERERLAQWMRDYGCEIPSYGGGALRTICVRRCDGYFFPISASTSRQQLSRDEQVCQSMYAGAEEASLFSYNTNDDVANARSNQGERYGDAWWAFLYRDHFSPTCATKLKDGIAALGERYWAANPRRAERVSGSITEIEVTRPNVMPMPRFRPVDRQQDPETIAARNGKLVIAPYVPPDQRPMADATGRSDGIRLVGESYYADLYDPTKPAPEPVQHRGPLGFDLIGAAMAAADRTGAVAEPRVE